MKYNRDEAFFFFFKFPPISWFHPCVRKINRARRGFFKTPQNSTFWALYCVFFPQNSFQILIFFFFK